MFDITFASSGRASTQGIKLGTNDFIGRLSVIVTKSTLSLEVVTM